MDKKGRLVALPPAVSDKTETSRGDAFEPCRSYSTHSEEWKTMHPDRGARFLATWSRGVAPMTRGPGIASNPSTPPGCRTDCLIGKCDTLAGSRDCLRCPVHGSSGLRPSTTWLKSGHPYRGASSSTLHYELNSFCTTQMRHPCPITIIRGAS